MEWKDVLDMGLGAVAFAAFLKLVFRDVAEVRERLARIEENGRRQAITSPGWRTPWRPRLTGRSFG